MRENYCLLFNSVSFYPKCIWLQTEITFRIENQKQNVEQAQSSIGSIKKTQII